MSLRHRLPFLAHIARWNGRVWATGIDGDEGIAIVVGMPDEPRFAKVPDLRTRPCDPKLIARPVKRVRVADAGPFHARVGKVLVQSRFVDAVRDMHPGCEWYAHNRAADGAIHAVVGNETVALVMGIADTAAEKRLARKRGLEWT